MKKGIELIAEERQRQIEKEKFTPEWDKGYKNEELVDAAICYAAVMKNGRYNKMPPHRWPWALDWWKPTPDNRIRELQKAGALIAAQIDVYLSAQPERKEGE